MKHPLEQPMRQEGLEDDARRLEFIKDKICNCVTEVSGYEKETLECLRGVRNELEQNPELKAHLPEISILLESVRYMLYEARIIPYKAHDPRTDTSRITEQVKREQIQLRKDMVEWSSTLRWHILSNKDNQKYLRALWNALSSIWAQGGWSEQERGFERGIYTEVGVYRLLEKRGGRIESFPHEDAELGTDFWVQRPNGTRYIVQAKSSSPARMGVHSNDDLKKYVRQWKEGERMPRERIGQVTKVIQDLDIAYEYARKRGIMVDGTYLIVLSSDLVDRPSGEPQWEHDEVKKIDAQVERLMQD